MKKRPTGVTILALLAIVGGILGIFGSLAIVVLGGFIGGASAIPDVQQAAGGADAATQVANAAAAAVGVGVATFVISVIQLIFGLGAWLLKKWAWTIGVLVEGLQILSVIVGWLVSGFTGSSLITLAIAAVILWYLFRPNVKAAFGRGAAMAADLPTSSAPAA